MVLANAVGARDCTTHPTGQVADTKDGKWVCADTITRQVTTTMEGVWVWAP